jgi:uncharacterized membrane protein
MSGATMSIKQILQGNWLGHPLHPALVHVPTGLWPSALIFDIVSRASAGHADPAFAMLSFWAILAGLIVAILAMPTGLADWWDIKPEKPAHKLGLWHMGLNFAVFVLFAINLAMRWNQPLLVSTAQLILSIIAVAILVVSGYVGGRMVFDQGIGVARQSRKQWRAVAEAAGANLPEAKS